MPRKTRAAAAKAQDANVDNAPQEVPLPPTSKHDREPLRSITPTSVDSLDNERARDEEMGKPKGKKGKKGGAKKKARKAVEETVHEEPEVIGDEQNEHGDAAVRANDAIVEAVEPKSVERPHSSLGRTTRLTRRQQALADAAPEADTPADLPVTVGEVDQAADEIAVDEALEPKAIAGELILSPSRHTELDDVVASPAPVVLEPFGAPETLSTTLQELPDRTRPEPLRLVASTTASRPESQVEDPIEAIDALEDEIEEVTKIIPLLESPLFPIKPRATKFTDDPKAVSQVLSTSSSKAVPVAKAIVPGARSLTAATQPSATNRIRSLAEPKKPTTALARSTSVKTRPKSVAGDTKAKDKPVVGKTADSKSVDYLAAKRRPISVSFPSPPPPPKSKKPTTTASFTLPGEAVAAKLKAQRLERQAREEEEAAKKREFKARPLPTVSASPCIRCGYRKAVDDLSNVGLQIRPKPVEVKQTAASRARQSMIGDPEKASTAGLKRSLTVTGSSTTSATRQNDIVAAKRTSVIGASKPALVSNTANTAAKRSSIIAPNVRTGTASNSTKERTGSSGSLPRNVSAPNAAQQRLKSREVCNRGQVDTMTREKAQREKDEAVKRARTDAAERGRQASREWAEKQKKASEKKKAANPVEDALTGASPSAELVGAKLVI